MNDSWKDKDLTWQLINCMTEDPIIRQGLFPGPGANVSTTKGGGLSKAHHHKELVPTVRLKGLSLGTSWIEQSA